MANSDVMEFKQMTRNKKYGSMMSKTSRADSDEEKKRWKKLMDDKKKEDAERKAKGLPEIF